jgi:hypothetical protein
MISGFRHDVDEICALLGFYAASSGNPLPTFRDNMLVGKVLPHDDALISQKSADLKIKHT